MLKYLAAAIAGALLSGAALASTATISWTAPAANTDGSAIVGTLTYNVYQGVSGGAMAKVQSAVAALTATITTGLTPGTIQCFAVSAVEGGVEGQQSPTACVTLQALTPAAPATPTVVISMLLGPPPFAAAFS